MKLGIAIQYRFFPLGRRWMMGLLNREQEVKESRKAGTEDEESYLSW